MKATVFIEGGAKGADSKYLQVRCRQGFHKLFANCGFPRQPALKAGGGRGLVYKLFSTAHSKAAAGDYVALLIDSEIPVADLEKTWAHLQARYNWERPQGASDEQVLLMTTCMETWIVSDRQALRKHYGADLQKNALPYLDAMELRDRHDIQESLAHATRNCRNAFQKGKRSFELLGKLRPNELRKHLPNFTRCQRVLKGKL